MRWKNSNKREKKDRTEESNKTQKHGKANPLKKGLYNNIPKTRRQGKLPITLQLGRLPYAHRPTAHSKVGVQV